MAEKPTFTQQEIEQENRRRRRGNTEPQPADCIHCGRPFNPLTASAGEHGLCDYCLHND